MISKKNPWRALTQEGLMLEILVQAKRKISYSRFLHEGIAWHCLSKMSL
jgi:transposase-like protein